MNEKLAAKILCELLAIGVQEFCVCPGGRNAPFCFVLRQNEHLNTYYWHEERSAAFFALGRSRAFKAPVAVIVTSGTAAGELLPAAMEAYYSGVPLVLITADRPRHYRGSGAPQTAEQMNLFGQYALYSVDLSADEPFSLRDWTKQGACHINVCFEEPKSTDERYALPKPSKFAHEQTSFSRENFEVFLSKVHQPLVVLSTLSEAAKEHVTAFLRDLNAPIYIEGISHLREAPGLQHLRVYNPDPKMYDSIIRIGAVPTHRMWRDLEELKLPVFSITEMPFKGLSYGEMEVASCSAFFQSYRPGKQFENIERESDKQFAQELMALLHEEPLSEPSLTYELSKLIPHDSHIYLGNSMPIRNWDVAATNEDKNFTVTATRGLNGIDGQLSCYLGLAQPKRENWAILGDLTTLYDLTAPWIVPQIEAEQIKIVVLNNYGGRIFARKFKEIEMQNIHNIQFEHFAKMWSFYYERWEQVPEKLHLPSLAMIELVSNYEATERFWKRYSVMKKDLCPHIH